MRIYIVPQTEITLLHLSKGMMQGDDSLDFENAVSVKGGDIDSNVGMVFEDDQSLPATSSLWDE